MTFQAFFTLSFYTFWESYRQFQKSSKNILVFLFVRLTTFTGTTHTIQKLCQVEFYSLQVMLYTEYNRISRTKVRYYRHLYFSLETKNDIEPQAICFAIDTIFFETRVDTITRYRHQHQTLMRYRRQQHQTITLGLPNDVSVSFA